MIRLVEKHIVDNANEMKRNFLIDVYFNGRVNGPALYFVVDKKRLNDKSFTYWLDLLDFYRNFSDMYLTTCMIDLNSWDCDDEKQKLGWEILVLDKINF